MSRSKIPALAAYSGAAGGGRHDGTNAVSGTPPKTSSSGSPPPKPKENFFDMPDNHNMDIWSPGFSKDLKRKKSAGQMAAAVVEDTSVERVGGAFIDEERSLKMPAKRPQKKCGATAMPGISEADGITSSKPQSHLGRSQSHQIMEVRKLTERAAERPSVTRPDLAYDRVKELEGKLERLEIGQWQPPSIHEIMNRLLLGKPVCMSWFKSMEDKLQLLDAAIATNDGNCVMAVVLFIRRTVNEVVFLNVLERRHVAAQHYINFLKQLSSWKELKALYRRLNHMETLAYFYLQECDSVSMHPGDRMRLIKSCPTEFRKVQQLRHPEDLQHVEEYSRLVNVQHRIEEGSSQGATIKQGTVLFQALTTTLLLCCRHFRGQERKAGNPEELRKLFNIPDNQYFQMDLLALALRKDWKGIERLVTTKGVLGIGKKKKSPIGFERVVRLLGQDRYRAPNDVLEGYLNEIDDLEDRYSLAMEVGLYSAGLETLICLKDRERVGNFINSVPLQKHYEIRDRINQVLMNSQIKWK